MHTRARAFYPLCIRVSSLTFSFISSSPSLSLLSPTPPPAPFSVFLFSLSILVFSNFVNTTAAAGFLKSFENYRAGATLGIYVVLLALACLMFLTAFFHTTCLRRSVLKHVETTHAIPTGPSLNVLQNTDGGTIDGLPQ